MGLLSLPAHRQKNKLRTIFIYVTYYVVAYIFFVKSSMAAIVGCMFDQFIHRWLRVPYGLHTTVRQGKNPRVTVLLIHGIGNSSRVWDDVIAKLPEDTKVITVDLLGFGQSPKPEWAEYNARTQARSVLATCLRLGIYGKIVIVGHSLGSLVAIEVARRYPALIKGLVLCSPPLYRFDDQNRTIVPKPEKVLTSIYKIAKKHPAEFLKIGELAVRYKLVSDAFETTAENVSTYMATLESAIINQTAIEDIQKLRCPIQILHGRFDLVVVAQNLTWLEQTRPNIKLRHVASGHEITGPMKSATINSIRVWL